MIGGLRHIITLQEQVIIKDELEQEIETWKEVYKVWAEIKPLSGKEYFKARQTKSDVRIQVTIRYRKEVHNQMRIEFDNQVYEIVSVVNVEHKNKYLQLLCKEGEKIA